MGARGDGETERRRNTGKVQESTGEYRRVREGMERGGIVPRLLRTRLAAGSFRRRCRPPFPRPLCAPAACAAGTEGAGGIGGTGGTGGTGRSTRQGQGRGRRGRRGRKGQKRQRGERSPIAPHGMPPFQGGPRSSAAGCAPSRRWQGRPAPHTPACLERRAIGRKDWGKGEGGDGTEAEKEGGGEGRGTDGGKRGAEGEQKGSRRGAEGERERNRRGTDGGKRNGEEWKGVERGRRDTGGIQEGYRREQKGAEEGGEKGKERRFSVHFERKRGIMEISTNFFKKLV